MATGDTKTFDFTYNGLTLQVIAIDNGDGITDFQIKCIAGYADVNALWWADAEKDGSSPTLSGSDSSLNMNGTKIDWDGYAKLSSTGLGTEGWDKITALTAGESYYAKDIAVDWASLITLGLRATSTSTDSGSIKAVDSTGIVVVLPTVSISDAAAVEEGGTAQFTITLSNAYTYDVKVYYTTQDGSATTAGSDYTGKIGCVIIPAGQTTATIDVATLDGNDTYEATENFTLKITSAVADIPDALGSDIPLTLTDDSGLGTITDNDPVPTASIAIDPASVAEDGSGNLVFTVTLSNPSAFDTTVNYSIGGSATNGSDYGSITGTLTIPANSLTGTITVDPTADNVYENDETVILTLTGGTTNGQNLTLGTTQATGTIANDDPAPQFSIDDVTVSEADGTITFTVTKTGLTDVASSVNYAVAPDSAGTPGDYTANDALSGTLNFAAGVTTQTITLNIVNDGTAESTEQFFVNLSGAVNATISNGQGIGTITDNDPACPVFGPTLSGSGLPATDTIAGDPNDFDLLAAPAPSGSTLINGTIGNDTIPGVNGKQLVYAKDGNDSISGGNGDDSIYGQGGNDNPLNGDNGSDVVFGGSGNDTINGGDETAPSGDALYGGSGNDNISGGFGNDTIVGGWGADILTGGGDADTFVYLSTSDTNDTINGFVSGTDKIDLSALDAIVGGLDDAFLWAGQTPTNTAQVAANSVSWYTSGGNVIVLADTDGNINTAEFMITLNGIITIAQSDFML